MLQAIMPALKKRSGYARLETTLGFRVVLCGQTRETRFTERSTQWFVNLSSSSVSNETFVGRVVSWRND